MLYHTIITHEYPDLDAMLCCYLLKYYGHTKYPGIESATVQFLPGGQLPKPSEELEKEGILAVDIGGGRLDTHPYGTECNQEKFELSAANLVAKDLDIHESPSLKNLLEFTRLQDSSGQSLRSRNPIDHSLALPNLIKGGFFYFGEKFWEMTQFFMEIFAAIEKATLEPGSFPLCDPNLIIAYNETTAYIPSNYNLQSLYLAYLAQKFLNKKISIAPIPPQSICFRDMESFLITNGLKDKEELYKLHNFVQHLPNDSYLLNSKALLDETVSVPYILKGFAVLHQNNPLLMLPYATIIFDNVLIYEIAWKNAIEEYKKNSRIHMIQKTKVVAISATNGMVNKIARWQDRADFIIYQDSIQGHVSLSINKLGKLQKYTLSRLAGRLRMAELLCNGNSIEEIPYNEFSQLGELYGWFLHQSLQLLVHGSPKAKRPASKIPFDRIVELCLCEFDKFRKMPEQWCPATNCLQEKCGFYGLRLPNCFYHREKNWPKTNH